MFYIRGVRVKVRVSVRMRVRVREKVLLDGEEVCPFATNYLSPPLRGHLSATLKSPAHKHGQVVDKRNNKDENNN
jgi:hypothetical protein